MTSPTPTLTNNTATTGEVNIAWNDSLRDGNWYSYRVYIRETGVPEWSLLEERFDVITNYSYDAYAFAAGVQNEVAVVEVTQVTLGEQTEGVYTNSATFTAATLSGYFLVDPDTPSNNFYLQHVSDDSWDDTYETGTFVLIGRGRKVDYGTHSGRSGSITAILYPTATRTVRSQLNELLTLRQSGSRVTFIRSPFGDFIRASITSIGHTRVAAGSDDYMTVTISWTEVA